MTDGEPQIQANPLPGCNIHQKLRDAVMQLGGSLFMGLDGLTAFAPPESKHQIDAVLHDHCANTLLDYQVVVNPNAATFAAGYSEAWQTGSMTVA